MNSYTQRSNTLLGMDDKFKDVDLNFRRHPITKDLIKRQGELSIKQSIMSLLMTSPGERLFQPGLGSGIYNMLFEPMGSMVSVRLERSISSIINKHEPRFQTTSVGVVPAFQENGYNITISGTIRNTNQEVDIDFFLERLR
jgi:phage baseplate assembly protein W